MKKRGFYVIAHNIRSLYNVGSIFRTAEAFGVDKIILSGYTGTPKNPRLQKTALGAEKLVPWEHHEQLKRVIEKLKKNKFQIVALENNVGKTTALEKFRPRFPLALILGEEVHGSKTSFLKMCDQIIEIPMHGQKESLNVSVAFGVAAHFIKNA